MKGDYSEIASVRSSTLPRNDLLERENQVMHLWDAILDRIITDFGMADVLATESGLCVGRIARGGMELGNRSAGKYLDAEEPANLSHESMQA